MTLNFYFPELKLNIHSCIYWPDAIPLLWSDWYVFCLFFYCAVSAFLLVYWPPLYVLDTNPLLVVYVSDIFFQFVICLSILFKVPLHKLLNFNSLILIRSNLSLFLVLKVGMLCVLYSLLLESLNYISY